MVRIKKILYIKVTPVIAGEKLNPINLDLLSCEGLDFRLRKGVVEMDAPNLRNHWISIAESKEQIESSMYGTPVDVIIRNTTEIWGEGNQYNYCEN